MKTDYVNSHPEVYLYAADTYKINGKYKEAIENYELYAQKVPDDPRGQLGAESTALIQEWLDNPSKYELTELKKVNSTKDSDFAACWTSSNYNEIVFTSTRDASTGKEKDGITGQEFTDLLLPSKTVKANGARQCLPMKAKASTRKPAKVRLS